jgi:branched-chain amino acid transport system permease protein
MTTSLQVIISGLTTGAIFALIALSYNIIFGATGILNFPQGAFLMVGAVVGADLTGSRNWSVAPALIVTVVLAAALGIAEERVAVRPATSRGNTVGWVVATFGFAIVLQAGVALILGPSPRYFPSFVSQAPHKIGGAVYNMEQVMLIAVALVVGFALDQFYRRTRLGWALTAISHDQEAAAMRGIPVHRLAVAVFGAGAALAALTGFLAGPLIGADPSMGFSYTLSGFVAAALGGIPDLRGAVVGGFLLGLIQAEVVQQFGVQYQSTVVFGVLIAVLMVRPRGLFGKTATRIV